MLMFLFCFRSQLEWNPDGETILTATTAPRLRIGNGFKVWHYSGALLHETIWASGQELLEVIWQRYADGVFSEKPISNVKVEGIQSSQPQSSKAVYVPPNIRSGGISASPRNPSEYQAVEKSPIPGIPIGYKVSQSQAKKNRNAKRRDANENANGNTNIVHTNAIQQSDVNPSAQNKRNNQRRTSRSTGNSNQYGQNNTTINNTNAENISPENDNQTDDTKTQQDKPKRDRRRNSNRNREPSTLTGDPEKDKRIRIVQQKLRDIIKLKARRANGDPLEANQVSKINSEAELAEELSTLKVSA